MNTTTNAIALPITSEPVRVSGFEPTWPALAELFALLRVNAARDFAVDRPAADEEPIPAEATASTPFVNVKTRLAPTFSTPTVPAPLAGTLTPMPPR